jgi:hypothetical protein
MDTFRIERYGHTRFWAVRDATDTLICVCVYKRGAVEVTQRLQARDDAQRWRDTNAPAQEGLGPAVWVDPAPWLL